MIATQDHLGIGIYSPREAAFYARVTPKLIKRWVFGDSGGRPVIQRELPDEAGRVITFLDFVQTLAIREIRSRHKLPLQKIRRGVEEARERYGIDYPLARNHCIYLFSDRQGEGHGDIVIRLDGDGAGDEGDVEHRYVQMTGRARGNYLIRTVVEMFLHDLAFDPVTHLAARYRPMALGEARVLLDPHRRFGEPVVDPGGYTAEALWHATNAEGGIRAAAEACGVGVAEVELANKYYDSLIQPEAA